MSHTKSNSCFFADLCLLLPLTQRPEVGVNLVFSILHGEDCHISFSVKQMFNENLDNAYDYILNDLRDNLPKHLQNLNCIQLSDVDGLLFESFFVERRKHLREKHVKSFYFILEGHIETWIVNQLHLLKRGQKVQVEVFLSVIYRELSNKYEELRSPVETLDAIPIEPKSKLESEMLFQGLFQEEDRKHMASAIEYQYTHNIWVIFLTYDEKSILNYAQNLRDNCLFFVSKPLYAFDHRRELSKEKRPIGCFQQFLNPTFKQKRFAEALSNELGITILKETS